MESELPAGGTIRRYLFIRAKRGTDFVAGARFRLVFSTTGPFVVQYSEARALTFLSRVPALRYIGVRMIAPWSLVTVSSVHAEKRVTNMLIQFTAPAYR